MNFGTVKIKTNLEFLEILRSSTFLNAVEDLYFRLKALQVISV